jgi:hypothetical protein
LSGRIIAKCRYPDTLLAGTIQKGDHYIRTVEKGFAAGEDFVFCLLTKTFDFFLRSKAR